MGPNMDWLPIYTTIWVSVICIWENLHRVGITWDGPYTFKRRYDIRWNIRRQPNLRAVCWNWQIRYVTLVGCVWNGSDGRVPMHDMRWMPNRHLRKHWKYEPRYWDHTIPWSYRSDRCMIWSDRYHCPNRHRDIPYHHPPSPLTIVTRHHGHHRHYHPYHRHRHRLLYWRDGHRNVNHHLHWEDDPHVVECTGPCLPNATG